VREPNPDNGRIGLTAWSIWPTWESWTWPGHDGKEIQVEVYSKYPNVRLYLNDKLIGEKPTTKEQEFKATFSLAYTPGILKAVGVENNKEMESTILKTADKPAKIKLIPDRKQILANGQDLSFVSVEVTDENGNINPTAENRIEFKVEGSGVIVAVDNANLKDLDSYVGNSRNAWNGRAMVVIKSTQSTGDIKLTASSSELAETTATIKVVK